MRRPYCFAVVLAFVSVVLALPGRAQDAPHKIKLLTQDTGWALFNSSLYWTTDFGKHWRDITPPGTNGASDVFFLDTFNGWAFIGVPDAGGPDGGVQLVLARTSDSGNSWTTFRAELPGWDVRQATPGGSGMLDFIDTMHGWLDLSIESSSAFNRGALFATSDGGRTWESVPAPVGFGWVKFISPETGWVAGGPANSELVVTRDGGKTWQRVRLAPPAGLPPDSTPSYRPPQFVSPREGFLPMSFNGWAAVVYETADGGMTWRPVVALTGPPGSVGDLSPLPIVDSTLLVPSQNKEGHRSLSMFSLSGPAPPAPSRLPTRTDVFAATFIDGNRGWVFTGWVYATADGGATWTDITPKPNRPGPHPASVPRRPVGVGAGSAPTPSSPGQ
ncbi:MAG TPA: YCF48-related protein [Candidatus Acidoferrales bacterium]|nr:YCF48-related protein [Candidatus Acidoferrales bacterium]